MYVYAYVYIFMYMYITSLLLVYLEAANLP